MYPSGGSRLLTVRPLSERSLQSLDNAINQKLQSYTDHAQCIKVRLSFAAWQSVEFIWSITAKLENFQCCQYLLRGTSVAGAGGNIACALSPIFPTECLRLGELSSAKRREATLSSKMPERLMDHRKINAFCCCRIL